jgi:MinD superfamily P-loop ATPase
MRLGKAAKFPQNPDAVSFKSGTVFFMSIWCKGCTTCFYLVCPGSNPGMDLPNKEGDGCED